MRAEKIEDSPAEDDNDDEDDDDDDDDGIVLFQGRTQVPDTHLLPHPFLLLLLLLPSRSRKVDSGVRARVP